MLVLPQFCHTLFGSPKIQNPKSKMQRPATPGSPENAVCRMQNAECSGPPFSSCAFFVFLTSIKQSYSNEFDNISTCAGVVIGDGASELRDLENEKNFDDTFELAIKAFYGEGLSGNRS